MELTTEQLKIRNNALKIAKFEGYEVEEDSIYGNIFYSDDNERTAIDTGYHNSWEWIMTVVYQCLLITEDREWHEWDISIAETLRSVDIKIVYDEVLKFIEFCNKENVKVYFQPEFVDDLYPTDKDDIEIHSFEVYKSRTEAQRDFPNYKIQVYTGSQIEEPTYRDEDVVVEQKESNYRVIAEVTTYCYLDVKAKSEEEAMQIGDEADGGEFVSSSDDGEWKIVEAIKQN